MIDMAARKNTGRKASTKTARAPAPTARLARELKRLQLGNEIQAERLKGETLKLRRKAAKARIQMLSTYSAAKKKRTDLDWRPSSRSADAAIINDLATMNPRARQMVRDDGAAVSGQGGFTRHVVGTGITPRAAAKDAETGELRAEFNKRANKLFFEWARRPKVVDVEGRRSFLMVQRHGMRELFAVGEAFALPVYQKRPEGVGLRLQLLEGEQLDTSKTKYEGRDVHGGIEIGDYGEAVAYHFTVKAHPLDKTTDSQRVPADRILHLMDPDRVRQTRGVTMMHAIMRKARHLGIYDEAEVIAKRGEASIGGAITTDPSLGPAGPTLGLAGADGDTELDANDNDQLNFEPGMMLRLRAAEKFELIDPKRPGGTYQPFMEMQLAELAAGMGSDYATVTRDYSRGTFSSQRQGLIETWDETDPLQQIMIDLWLRDIWELFITYAVAENRLEAAGFFGRDRAVRESYLAADWGPPAKRWIDPAKQAAAEKIKIDIGLTSPQRVLNELGVDWRELFDEIAEARAYADEKGIEIAGVNAPAKQAPAEPRPTKKPSNVPSGEGEEPAEKQTADRDVVTDAVVADAVGEPEVVAAMG